MNLGNVEAPYQVYSKAVLYGADALQFNIDTHLAGCDYIR